MADDPAVLEGEVSKAEADPAPASFPASQENLGREQILDFIVESFLRTLGTGGYHMFARCYKCLYKTQPSLTKCVYDQFVSHLQSSIQEEIKELKEEGNLKVLFESLDKLVEEAKEKETPAWRPSGIPEADIRNVVVPYLLKQREFLRKALREKEESNARLAESVLAGRKKIADLQEEIQKRKETWQATGAEGRKTVSLLGKLP